MSDTLLDRLNANLDAEIPAPDIDMRYAGVRVRDMPPETARKLCARLIRQELERLEYLKRSHSFDHRIGT